jgi:AhpD family alkylhydroperoxidase
MDRLTEIARRRKVAHTRLRALESKVYRAFLQMEEAAFADGALPKKVKELIAVGISVKIDCESCMQWHIERAAGAGATMREVLEAIEVGIEMGGGPATVSARFALEVLERTFADAGARARHRVARGRSRQRRRAPRARGAASSR